MTNNDVAKWRVANDILNNNNSYFSIFKNLIHMDLTLVKTTYTLQTQTLFPYFNVHFNDQ